MIISLSGGCAATTSSTCESVSGDQPRALFFYLLLYHRTVEIQRFFSSGVIKMPWYIWAVIGLVAVLFIINTIVIMEDRLPGWMTHRRRNK